MGGQYVQETWDARIAIKGKHESLNGILEGEQETSGDSKEISRKADANIERRIKTILDPKSGLILNAKREDPILTGPYARVTEEEKNFILAELEMLRWTETSKQRSEYDKLLAQCQDYFCKGHLAHYWLERAGTTKVGSKRSYGNSQS